VDDNDDDDNDDDAPGGTDRHFRLTVPATAVPLLSEIALAVPGAMSDGVNLNPNFDGSSPVGVATIIVVIEQ